MATGDLDTDSHTSERRRIARNPAEVSVVGQWLSDSEEDEIKVRQPLAVKYMAAYLWWHDDGDGEEWGEELTEFPTIPEPVRNALKHWCWEILSS